MPWCRTVVVQAGSVGLPPIKPSAKEYLHPKVRMFEKETSGFWIPKALRLLSRPFHSQTSGSGNAYGLSSCKETKVRSCWRCGHCKSMFSFYISRDVKRCQIWLSVFQDGASQSALLSFKFIICPLTFCQLSFTL